MNVSELMTALELKLLAGEDGLNNELQGCYICDLLSYVMSRASKGNVWITVQTNINVVAVSVLTEVGCVIVPENIAVEQITIDKANKEGVPILSTNKTAYEIACFLKEVV